MSGLALLAQTALGQSVEAFPNRPIRLVVAFPPGGNTDPAARVLAADTGLRLNQTIVVENKAGAAGAIATEFVAKAPGDGYTLLFHTNILATDPTFKRNAAYDVKRDLTPVSLVVSAPGVFVVNSALPVSTLAEFVAYARANPGKLNYCSSGEGSSAHLLGERLKRALDIDIVHVPYKGSGPALVGLAANEVQFAFDSLTGTAPLVAAGKLRSIAVTTAQRVPQAPAMPTFKESGVHGLEDFVWSQWLGIFAPSRTPAPVVEKLYQAFRESMESAPVRARMIELGNTPWALSPSESAKALDRDIASNRTIIEAAKISLQ